MDSQVLNIPPIGGQWPVRKFSEGGFPSKHIYTFQSKKIRNAVQELRIH